MALLKITSPHAHGPTSTTWVMQQVILATIPGVVALTYFFGFGTLTNIVWASIIAVISEAAMLKLRKRPIAFYLKDYSAVVTAVLLAIALPPYAPWWVVMLGVVFAIVIAKHLYGGMGYNPFNPAMVAYVVLLISLPVQMTQWAAPLGSDGFEYISPITAFLNNFGFVPIIDAHTMATPLDVMKQNSSLMIEQLWADNSQFGLLAGKGWEMANIGFLLGGIYLLTRKVFTWHTPISMIAMLGLMAAVFYDGGSSASGGSPFFHLFSGATMLGAFFIATDPVTSAVSVRGRIVYGACIGALVYIIRVWGNYPDAIAFSILLMNFAAPFIDHYTQPTTYGYGKQK
ncbi:Electron transport complex subunit RsxD [BD1-7 clade bacterium]|uniref:Ion-translocating oxidoreductase complex subunit D n=1 Tax=BD1-7 clade bacterium TaxID=2029982 RepID=A0A5S9PA50_9GAMM|nr:Electron transport complex subunit RsxD [BD1-7 clade bacterium]